MQCSILNTSVIAGSEMFSAMYNAKKVGKIKPFASGNCVYNM